MREARGVGEDMRRGGRKGAKRTTFFILFHLADHIQSATAVHVHSPLQSWNTCQRGIITGHISIDIVFSDCHGEQNGHRIQW